MTKDSTLKANKAYLLLGSNLSDPLKQLSTAEKMIISSIGKIEVESSIYKTAAWGKNDQPDFLNQVLLVSTTLTAEELLAEIFRIEKSLGRIRTEKNAARIIDIDILFFNNDVITKKELYIPHPAIPDRRFVLVPLNEIAPLLVHPVTKKNVKELLLECKDELHVKRF